MKIIMVFFSVFIYNCAGFHVVHTRVTSTSATDSKIITPVSLFWILPEDDLLKQQQINVCKNYFSQSAPVVNLNQDCKECLNVLFVANMGGSDTSSVPTTNYNALTNRYYKCISQIPNMSG
jgi:hypothetical protein